MSSYYDMTFLHILKIQTPQKGIIVKIGTALMRNSLKNFLLINTLG